MAAGPTERNRYSGRKSSIATMCARQNEPDRRRRIHNRGQKAWIMAALVKYLVSVAIIGSAIFVGAIFLGFAAVIETPALTTPAWKNERLKPAPDTPYIAQRSLSPIYPATPGKELLGKPVQTVVRVAKHHAMASAKPVGKPVTAKRLDVSQGLRAHEFPQQIYAAVEHDRNYSQQSYGYAEELQARSRTVNILAHGLY